MENPVPEDRLLLERLRAGEDAAFGELFSRHSAVVYRLAVGLVNDRAEAEDLTAEAFFRVLQAIRRGSGPVDNVRGYLLIVARRVAWEWSLRRRDVPVSDEELTHRAPSDPDTSGALTERNLIRRAFSSLPERWRNVLWKMEVEGERPAAVAINFGLSPNATAALARRARQGLRAAYLQAHLAADRSATGCRSVLEKLGAYTAGSTSGIEYRRIRAHLSTCASCTAMYAELRDVCSGLRAHAAYVAVPATLAGGAAAAHLAGGTTGATTAATAAGAASGGLGGSLGAGLGATVKGLLATTKIQVGIAAGSAAAIGAIGIATIAWGGDGASSPTDLASRGAVRLELTEQSPSPLTSTSLHHAEGELSSQASVAPGERDGGPATPRPRPNPPAGTSSSSTVTPTSTGELSASPLDAPGGYDDSVPVLFRETTVERYTQVEGGVLMVYETTTVTEVNSLDQTRTSTQTTSFAEPSSTTSDPTEESSQSAEPSESSSETSSTSSANPSGGP